MGKVFLALFLWIGWGIAREPFHWWVPLAWLVWAYMTGFVVYAIWSDGPKVRKRR
jgi:hypothetical protein